MAAKSRRRSVSTDRRFRANRGGSDFGTLERWQHTGRVLELTERAGVMAARVTEEHCLDLLVLRKLITKIQSEAAFRLKGDYQRAGLGSHVTGSYNPVRVNAGYSDGTHERDDLEEAAYQRWRKAVRGLGMALGDCVVSVVCHDLTPSEGHVVLVRRGLEKLVLWYGLSED